VYTFSEISYDELESAVLAAGVNLPIEQTGAWAAYEKTIPGRSEWGALVCKQDDVPVAYVMFDDYETHGYHYLRAHHGPIWLEAPDADQERALLEDLVAYVKDRDKAVAFMRLAVDHDLDICRPCLSTIPYDATVIVDVTGGDDEILARMKPRGRRDVRKALRESPATCADETDKANESFEEYYAVMVETGERDGFTPAPLEEYQAFIRLLGPERCRVFVGRLEDGTVVNWAIDTISGTRGTRFYAASSTATMRMHVTDKLAYFELCELGRLGCTDVDMMAVGSDFSPELLGLNEFKTKFTKDPIARVAPDRDLPVKGTFYQALVLAKRAKNKLAR